MHTKLVWYVHIQAVWCLILIAECHYVSLCLSISVADSGTWESSVRWMDRVRNKGAVWKTSRTRGRHGIASNRKGACTGIISENPISQRNLSHKENVNKPWQVLVNLSVINIHRWYSQGSDFNSIQRDKEFTIGNVAIFLWGAVCNIHTFVDRSNFCPTKVTFVWQK